MPSIRLSTKEESEHRFSTNLHSTYTLVKEVGKNLKASKLIVGSIKCFERNKGLRFFQIICDTTGDITGGQDRPPVAYKVLEGSGGFLVWFCFFFSFSISIQFAYF